MNNHELDSLESSEALGEDDSAVDSAFDFAFDLGTSPHGLPADLPVAVSNLAARSDCAPSASSGFGVPEVFRTSQVLKDSGFIRQRAREAHYPLVLTATQMKLVQQALRLAIEDAIEAMSDEPDGRHEIQPDIDGYNQIHAALKQAKAANMGGRSEEGTSVEL
jgi:hypothetical protein